MEEVKGAGGVRFAAPPAVGEIFVWKGQAYRCKAVEPYTRKSDGGASWLLSWSAGCLTCGERFGFKSGLASGGFVRRCKEHRLQRGPRPVPFRPGRKKLLRLVQRWYAERGLELPPVPADGKAREAWRSARRAARRDANRTLAARAEGDPS